MKISDVKIGTRLELEVLTDTEDSVQSTYISQFVDILNTEEISISCPIFESKFVIISIGKKIRLSFHDEKYGLMCFEGVISSREKKDNIILLNVRITSEIEKIQRRNYFRLDCLLDVEYEIAESIKSEQPVQKTSPKKAIAKNISGSGICIVTDDDRILKNTEINLLIFLKPDSYITTKCVVMRSSTLRESSKTKHELGLYFKDISQKDQDMLIKFIFDQQRLQLKKNT